MIKEVRLRRFKRFDDEIFRIHESGLTICAGPNSSGKSTLLHALAVWSFGVMVVRQFKGGEAVCAGYAGQGAGISDDDFTPINVPDLRHLWLNLKSQVRGEGYSMSINVKWDDATQENSLTMAFSLVQDRLFVKAQESNLIASSKIPTIVYVPPVAGVDAREEFATLAKRRAMLGRGLAGAVLRNFLLDLESKSRAGMNILKGSRKHLPTRERDAFRKSDPWERLNGYARETFGFELKVTPFDADFHSVIKVDVIPKRRVKNNWRNSGVSRDLMVEGSGAQQWLTVLTFALSPDTNVLLLDEPDAHLFTRLKLDLVDILNAIGSADGGPQVLMATHATEILKRHPVDRILSFGTSHPKYLLNEAQRTKLISGLGDDYSTLIESARASRALLFVENDSDARILKAVAKTCGYIWPDNLAIIANTHSHSDRIKFYRVLLEAIDGLRSVSLRDRDEKKNIREICADTLVEKGVNTNSFPDFSPLTWRRREIENYALEARAIARAVGEPEAEKWWRARGWAWPHDPLIEEHLQDCDVKKPLGDLLGKLSIEDFFGVLPESEIHGDLKIVTKAICSMSKGL